MALRRQNSVLSLKTRCDVDSVETLCANLCAKYYAEHNCCNRNPSGIWFNLIYVKGMCIYCRVLSCLQSKRMQLILTS